MRSNSPFKKTKVLGNKFQPPEIHIDLHSPSPSFRDTASIYDPRTPTKRDSDVLVNRSQRVSSIVDPSPLLYNREAPSKSDFELLKRNLVANRLFTGTETGEEGQPALPYNPELYFNILTMKKMIYELVQINEKLRHKIFTQQEAEPKYLNRIKTLSMQIEELSLKERIDFDRPSDVSQEELDEIDRNLLHIDDNLDSAMGSKGQENFIQQVIDSNKEFFHIAENYSQMLQQLEDNTQQFKMMLVNVNSVNWT